MEGFVDIKGYEGLYLIDRNGNVKSLRSSNNRKGEFMTHTITKGSYPTVALTKGTTKHKVVHRLLAVAFIPNPENKPCVNHINGIKTDFRLENLEWCTYSENSKHAFRTGLQSNKGENQSRSKLKEADVIYIRTAGKPAKEMQALYKTTLQTIYDIRWRKSWKHI